jgi:Asp-tRNA(Asn)/Glu-tRNA(Gln) amidotransferase A subunit family amidase
VAPRPHRGGADLGPLHGLPIAIKDLVDTAGIRTTYGSTAFADHVPAADDLLVRRLRGAGAIIVGKTNTPELGAGSHTFNAVFGTTRNPWALDRSAGGSSGGAGAALAAGMLPIADGSDLGGSRATRPARSAPRCWSSTTRRRASSPRCSTGQRRRRRARARRRQPANSRAGCPRTPGSAA